MIWTKWEFRNNLNEDGKVVENKAILICKGHSQVEYNAFEETFSLLDRLESVRAFSIHMLQEFQILPNGFQVNISKWKLRSISIHWVAQGI